MESHQYILSFFCFRTDEHVTSLWLDITAVADLSLHIDIYIQIIIYTLSVCHMDQMIWSVDLLSCAGVHTEHYQA